MPVNQSQQPIGNTSEQVVNRHLVAVALGRLRALRLAVEELRDVQLTADPVSQGRWLVSLTRWTAANPRPCHWISLMHAEPRYSR